MLYKINYYDCLFDWLTESEWNLKLLKLDERERNDFPKLSSLHFISMNSNSFQHKTPEWRWHDFFHLKSKGFLKRFEFQLEIFQILKKTLCNSMIFMREDKMTSSIIWNMSWKSKRIKLKVIWKYFETPFQIWNYLDFIQIIFLLKINKWK